MGRRGPPPDPFSGRTRRGLNSLKGRMVTLPLRYPDLPKATMPKWLSPEAKRFWKANASGLEKRGLLDALSASLFAGLCEQMATAKEAAEILRREGMVVTGPRGKQIPHPAFRILMASEKLCLGLMREFGMTPASRSRLGITGGTEPESDEEREFRRLLDGEGDGGE